MACPATSSNFNNVVIVSAVRTPIGCFQGSLSSLSASQLASVAIKAAVKRAGLKPEDVDEVYMGQVLATGGRQGTCKQASLGAGLPTSVPTTSINKRCASGMKAIMLAAQSIKCGDQEIIVAGGMESLSNVPFLIKRGALPYGGFKVEDAMLYDGLMDPYNNCHMGDLAEAVAKKMSITREEQDEFAIRSYKLSAQAVKDGMFDAELVPVPVPQKRGDPIMVTEDEEYKKVNFDKLKTLNPVFQKEGGTITAANASTLNDGAAICVLVSEAKAKALGIAPLARIIGYADAAEDPADFPTAPALAVQKLLKICNVKIEDISLWEINEAFSAVVLANMKRLGLKVDNVNIHGGGVSIGHPVGMSGARITGHLAHVLQKGKLGVATICNGGGGAAAILIEKL